MALKRISDLTAATLPLSGTEEVELDVAGVARKCTAQDIADLGGGGGGSGDVVGPASATADRIALFDGTSGKLLKDGGKTIADITVIDVQTPSNASGTVTLNFASASKYVGAITLAANVTTLAFSNLPGSGKYAEYELHIAQDGTGSRTFAIPASHKALGGSDTAIASAANAVTVLTASTVDNGTTWRYAMQESA
jgi:hypothetical protein